MKTIHNVKSLFERRKELRNNSTPQEILLWSKLKHSQVGFKFRRQHSIGGYIVDFYCPAKKLIIELDGKHHLKKENKLDDERLLAADLISDFNQKRNQHIDKINLLFANLVNKVV